jgi:hypothetical protein
VAIKHTVAAMKLVGKVELACTLSNAILDKFRKYFNLSFYLIESLPFLQQF